MSVAGGLTLTLASVAAGALVAAFFMLVDCASNAVNCPTDAERKVILLCIALSVVVINVLVWFAVAKKAKG